ASLAHGNLHDFNHISWWNFTMLTNMPLLPGIFEDVLQLDTINHDLSP
ncbi:hypothetical protein EC990672_1962, partial [Escherichia coli 99.0672]